MGIGSSIRAASTQFGARLGAHIATICLNDAPVSDYSVSSTDTSVCTVSKNTDGTFKIKVIGSGSTTSVVHCGDTEAQFYLTARV